VTIELTFSPEPIPAELRMPWPGLDAELEVLEAPEALEVPDNAESSELRLPLDVALVVMAILVG
jgi:hypothetical protein